MPPAELGQTIDLSAGLPDPVRDRYDAAWRDALLTDSPPPDREPFLADVGQDREHLASALNDIDGAYLRLRDLVRAGVATLSPAATDPPRPVDPPRSTAAPQHAETLDADRPVGEQPEPPAGGARYAETIDSAPAGGGDARTPAPPPLEAGAAVGGYELLGVIARGGMGVVYKARHTRLDRPAAIKMVLAGAHASADQLARFRAEAQVVAGLQHPNIVQLYEVGEHDDLPYIALEFVDGGSRAHKAGGRPLDPREAAGLVEAMARAVHYAHGRGVVHRDLKPANVLLTAGGVPKVADFGLAKRLEADSGQTRSGTLLGTPAYMAPEQAAGRLCAVGPHTDVYALGAILYELLTGGPPFSGATPLETVLAVLRTDPVPPGRLRPGVPRDLETVCLKCLEKDPPKRYASAADLADDLRRFLAGETVRARPVGRAERAWRWARRNPGVAALSAAVLLLLTTVAGVSAAAAVRVRGEKWAAEASAAAALDARGRAESALGEAERQKGVAERNETAALAARGATEAALGQTEAARAEAVTAHRRADDLATVAAAEREGALDALGGLILNVERLPLDAPGAQQLKRELLALALDGLKKIPAAGDDKALDVRMAEGHRRLGDLAQRLGDLALARRSHEQVDRIVRAQAEANPADPACQRNLSVAESKLGELAALSGDRAAARRHYEEARAIRAKLAEGGDTRAKIDLAQILFRLGDVSDPGPAFGLYAEALRLREEVLKAAPGSPAAARDVWVSLARLADRHLMAGDPAAARPHAEQAVALAEQLAKAAPGATSRVGVARSRARLGDVCRAEGRAGDARKEYEAALRAVEPVAAGNPKDLPTQVTYGLCLAHAGRPADAARVAARVREQAPQHAFLLYNAACIYGVAAEGLGEKPEADRTPEDRKLGADCGEGALGCLKTALAAGYSNHDQIRTDPELAAVRKLPGFAEIARGLR